MTCPLLSSPCFFNAMPKGGADGGGGGGGGGGMNGAEFVFEFDIAMT